LELLSLSHVLVHDAQLAVPMGTEGRIGERLSNKKVTRIACIGIRIGYTADLPRTIG